MKIKVKTVGIIEYDLNMAKNRIHILEARLHNTKEALLNIRSIAAKTDSHNIDSINIFELCCNALKEINK